MLIILEGTDKSGKSLIAAELHRTIPGSVVIKKTYSDILYPIDFTDASMHDWETLFDRLIFANPDTVFIADRSFVTQYVYQYLFGNGDTKMQPKHVEMLDKLVKCCESIDTHIIVCESDRYEFDDFIKTTEQIEEVKSKYRSVISTMSDSINTMIVNTTKAPFSVVFDKILTEIGANKTSKTNNK